MTGLNNRVEWIDRARGIGILFVILGHVSIPFAATKLIFSFHMPFFFLLSGLVFSASSYPRFSDFLLRKVKTLLVPYLFFYLVMVGYWFLIGNHFGASSGLPASVPLAGFVYSSAGFLVDLFRPLWFLTCLFVVQVVFYVIVKWTGQKKWFLAGVLAASALLGYATSRLLSFRLPWSADTALTAMVFYGIGFLLKERQGSVSSYFKNRGWSFVVLPVLLLSLGVFCFLNGTVDLFGNQYGNFFFFYAAAFSGAAATCLVAQGIQKGGVLVWIGRNSITFFGLHLVGVGIVKGLVWRILGIPLASTERSLGWGLIYTIAALVVLSPAVYFMNRAIPRWVGRWEEGPK